MSTQISPMLAVRDPAAATQFYQRAFGATVRWQIGDPAEVAGLSIGDAEFYMARESPPHGTNAPDGVGHTTVRIELFVEDPRAVQATAVAAGAREGSEVVERKHETVDGAGLRMLQGGVIDPYGHVWLIGKFLD